MATPSNLANITGARAPKTQIIRRVVAASPAPATTPALPRTPTADPRISLRSDDAGFRIKQVNPDAIGWDYFDAYILGAVTMPGESAAINYAQWPRELPFFANHTKANTRGICNNAKENALDSDFVIERIGVELAVPPDAAFAAGKSASVEFVSVLLATATFELLDKNDAPLYQTKLTRLRTGGGIHVQAKEFAQGVAANRETGLAGNGRPDGFFPLLERPIPLRQDESFTMRIVTPEYASGPVATIQALQALTSGQFTVVSVILSGFKGPADVKGKLRGLSLPVAKK